MRRKLWILACIFILMIVIDGCNKDVKSDEDTVSTHTNWMETITQDEVHKILGEPTATLSGCWADMYYLGNGTKIFIYYEAAGKVGAIKIYDNDGSETQSIDISNN